MLKLTPLQGVVNLKNFTREAQAERIQNLYPRKFCK